MTERYVLSHRNVVTVKSWVLNHEKRICVLCLPNSHWSVRIGTDRLQCAYPTRTGRLRSGRIGYSVLTQFALVGQDRDGSNESNARRQVVAGLERDREAVVVWWSVALTWHIV